MRGGKPARPGRQNLNPRMTVTTRIRRRGEHDISRKTIARGMPGLFRCTCGDYARVPFHIAREAMGALGTRDSLRPLICEARTVLAQLGRLAPRDRDGMVCTSG